MNEQKLQALFAANPQETPEAFHRAMTQTLDGIVAQERIEQARARSERPRTPCASPGAPLVLAAADCAACGHGGRGRVPLAGL